MTQWFEGSFCEAEPMKLDGHCDPLCRVNATALRNVCEANLPPSETRYGFFDSLCMLYQYSSHAQNDKLALRRKYLIRFAFSQHRPPQGKAYGEVAKPLDFDRWGVLHLKIAFSIQKSILFLKYRPFHRLKTAISIDKSVHTYYNIYVCVYPETG